MMVCVGDLSVRHSMYLGVVLVAIGIPVYTWSLAGLLIMPALTPVFLVRIRLEERMLIDKFGDAYLAYQKATGKLIRFI